MENNIISYELDDVREDSLRPTHKWGRSTKIWLSILCTIAAWGLFAFIFQLRNGLGVTAMRNYVSWGLYISTFVFFIGISHSGTLVSAILRITKQEWRRPITRSADTTFSVNSNFSHFRTFLGLRSLYHHIFRRNSLSS